LAGCISSPCRRAAEGADGHEQDLKECFANANRQAHLLSKPERTGMSFITGNTVFWRMFILALFIISMLGPWAFDLLHVPAQYPCGKPSVRLYGDFCGYPMSGFGAFIWVSGSFFYLLGELRNGNIAASIPDFMTLFFTWIIFLPFFSTILLTRNKNSRRLQTMNLIAWGLAGLATLTIFVLQTNRDQFAQFFYLLWGICLYILVAIGAIVFEILVLRSNTNNQ
jgi:ABC-type Na+ efflux pump permease subunit